MKYKFIREWSGVDTLEIEADSLEEAEQILESEKYEPNLIVRSDVIVNDEWLDA